MELRTSEAFWLGCWDALDEAAVLQLQLVQGFVVVLD